MLRLAMIRTASNPVNRDYYNSQEIGLAKALATKGVQTHIFTAALGVNVPKQYALPHYENYITITEWPVWKNIYHNQCLLQPIENELRKNHYDLIQLHDSQSVGTVQVANYIKHLKTPSILYQGVYFHPNRVKKIGQILFEQIGKTRIQQVIRSCIAKTKQAGEYLHFFGYPNIEILPVGLEIDTIDSNEKVIDIRSKYQLDRESILLLYIGRVEKRRNPKFILDICFALKNAGTKCSLVMVGEGPLTTAVKSYASYLGLNENIIFVNKVHQKEIASYYLSADILIHPSEHEIFGMVFLEAFHFGLPIIALRSPGAETIIDHNINGFLMDNLNTQLWIDVISKINTGGLLKNMKTNCQKKASDFEWANLKEKYLAHYQRALA